VDLRETRRGGIAFVRVGGGDLAELRAEGDLRRMVELLIGAEHERRRVRRRADDILVRDAQRGGDVHAVEQGAGPPGQGDDLDAGFGGSGHGQIGRRQGA